MPFGVQPRMDFVMQHATHLPSLCPEEALILSALRDGLTNEAISSLHGLDIETVRSLSRAAMTKLHTRSRAELMKAAKAFG